MTGIERLRAIAGAWDEWGLGGTLADIADQIEREHNVSDREEHDAAVWVRDHGGLDHVRAEWRSRVPYDLYVRRRQSLLGHIAECETALGRRNQRIEELGRRINDLTTENAELRRHAMPDDYEWPRYEDGELVQIGDDVIGKFSPDAMRVRSVEFTDDYTYLREGNRSDWVILVHPGERVKRHSVLAADGEPLEVGQTVWDVESGEELKVEKLCDVGLVQLLTRDGVSRYVYPDQLTHQRPVLDADGVPIHEGDTVYFVDGREQECSTVVRAKYDYKDEPYVQLGRLNEAGYPTYTNCSCIDPSQLTHTKPEPPDSRQLVIKEIGDEMAARIDLLVSSGRWSDAD